MYTIILPFNILMRMFDIYLFEGYLGIMART